MAAAAGAQRPWDVALRADLVVPALLCLPAPWEVVPLSAVCRSWRAQVESHPEIWSTFSAEGAAHLPALRALLPRAKGRLRVLRLSKVGSLAGPLPGLAGALAACEHLEDLSMRRCEEVSLDDVEPAVLRTLARSLRRLDIRGCRKVHPVMLSLLGGALRHLEFGWASESFVRSDSEMRAWTSAFPRHVFREVSARCPDLVTLRAPGYQLMSFSTPRSQAAAAIEDFAAIGLISGLARLRRLDLCCCQLLPDHVLVHIANGCRRLRSLNLRAVQGLSDEGLLAVARQMGATLEHINISCCSVSEHAVQQLILRCSRLKTLDLCYCEQLGPGIVAFLCAEPSRCPGLRMLGAGGLDVGDDELRVLVEKYHGSMEHLGIGSATRITDSGLQLLATLPRLKRLSAHKLEGLTIAAMTSFCLSTPALRDVDADDCRYAGTPTSEEQAALQQALAMKPYDYCLSDSESEGDADPADPADPAAREAAREGASAFLAGATWMLGVLDSATGAAGPTG